jgi:hypothetical protein
MFVGIAKKTADKTEEKATAKQAATPQTATH